MNDKLMIQNAGIGIAMGQSTPRIKEIADYVTEDNDDDGVKKAIEKYCTICRKKGQKAKKKPILQKCYKNINFLLQDGILLIKG